MASRIRDLINGLLLCIDDDGPSLSDPEFVDDLTAETYYSISGGENNSTIDTDIALLTLILPQITTIETLRFHGPTVPSIRLFLLQQFIETLFRHSSIRTLEFGNGALNVPITKIITNIIRQSNTNCCVTSLDLADNDTMEIEAIVTILESIKYNNVLETLDLSGSMVCYRSASEFDRLRLGRILCELLRVNTTLKVLDVGYNNLSRSILSGLIFGLPSNTTLEHLVCGGNNLQNYGAIQFADVLRYNQRLIKLNLKSNSIGNDGAIAIADTLRYYNKTLTELDIFGNTNITTPGYTALANVLKTNTTLNAYCIGGGEVSYIVPFLESLQYNTTLEHLDLDPPPYTESSEVWDTLKTRILQMFEYNNTIDMFYMDWFPPHQTTAWIDDDERDWLAPKKGSRQRSDMYNWLFQTWIF